MVQGLQRVVVTGLGAITPIGNDVSSYWEGLSTARNGVAGITLFDASRHACRFAAEVKDFDPSLWLEPKESKRWDRFCQFGVIAAKQAVAHAGLTIDESNQHRVGTAIGSGVGGLLMMETQAHVLKDRGPDRVSPFCVPMMIPNMATGLTAIALGAKGPSSAVATACAAGSNAIGDAYRLIQLGLADVMVAGGAESAITPLGVAGFASAKALSFRNDDPTTASRPFDAERNGFVIGEGAGVIVLESLEHAQARGAEILAEVKRVFPHVREPKQQDICYATQNRQDAVKVLAPAVDVVIVVGSHTSSNSNRLRELAQRLGTAAYMVDAAEDLQAHWLEGRRRVGLTAGASAPDILVQQVIARLREMGAVSVRKMDGVEEKIRFPLPLGLGDKSMAEVTASRS